MLFQTTPDTSGYMVAGYIIAFVTMGIYVASMYIRSRNLKQDLSMLESMDKEQEKRKGQPEKLSRSGGGNLKVS